MTEQLVVGVTGRYCAGKNTLVTGLVSRGFVEIDVDRIGHGVLGDQAVAVIQRFGDKICNANGSIDRARLGRIVFSDKRALVDLEAILHPAMVATVERRIDSSGSSIVINAAVLHKMRLDRLCHKIICVTAPFLVRLRRAQTRDGLSLRQALRRLISQRGICPKRGQELVDTITVGNAGSREDLLACLANIIPDLDSV